MRVVAGDVRGNRRRAAVGGVVVRAVGGARVAEPRGPEDAPDVGVERRAAGHEELAREPRAQVLVRQRAELHGQVAGVGPRDGRAVQVARDDGPRAVPGAAERVARHDGDGPRLAAPRRDVEGREVRHEEVRVAARRVEDAVREAVEARRDAGARGVAAREEAHVVVARRRQEAGPGEAVAPGPGRELALVVEAVELVQRDVVVAARVEPGPDELRRAALDHAEDVVLQEAHGARRRRARARGRRPRLRHARAVDLLVEAPRVALALGEGLEVLARRDGHGRGAEGRAQAAEAVRRVREARRQQHELVVHLRVEHREQEAGGDADRGPRRRRAEAHRSAAFTPPASRASLVHNLWATIASSQKSCGKLHTSTYAFAKRLPPRPSRPEATAAPRHTDEAEDSIDCRRSGTAGRGPSGGICPRRGRRRP